MAGFVLEVRTEEIPANALRLAREQLERGCRDRLVEAGFADFSVRALSTSRRLIVLVDDLPDRQVDRTERVTGPPRTVAFDDDGNPTKAAEGFARKLGIAVDQLELEEKDKGSYLAATVVREGRPTVDILAEVIPAVFGELRFPRMMRWGRGDHEFVRPVHGVLALLDSEVVPIELFGVRSDNRTHGHRVHAPQMFELAHAAEYIDALQLKQVLVDPDQRRQKFAARADELVGEVGCQVHRDEALVAEHVELVEYPGLLLGSFDERFLELPREVVITTLRYHQKCLVLEHDDGSLAPQFLTVVDRRDDPEGLVRQGNEWVIEARLADARFFFEEDRKQRLEDLVPDLARLEFHRALGTLADKAERVGALAVDLAQEAKSDVATAGLVRAARLAKTDLLTNVVVEFPELQGIMGGHYLRLDGEADEIWTAARDHYSPQGFDGEIPASEVGRIVGVADRLDTLAGLFGIGEVPSGSRDPHGLRRAAQGLVKIAAETGWNLDLGNALRLAVATVADLIDRDAEKLAVELFDFVADRVRRYLMDVVGVAFDTADAVMAAGWTKLPKLVARARALEEARVAEAFRWLALGFKRVRNITDGQPDGAIDPDSFQQDEERELHLKTVAFAERLDDCLEAGRFDDAFAAMGELADVLERFFVEVLVMTDDDSVRFNRIAILKSLGTEFLKLADLSKLQIEGGNG